MVSLLVCFVPCMCSLMSMQVPGLQGCHWLDRARALYAHPGGRRV